MTGRKDPREERARIQATMQSFAENHSRDLLSQKIEAHIADSQSQWPSKRLQNVEALAANFEMTVKCYLGHSSTIRSHYETLEARYHQYQADLIPNFYAFVLPGGNGKTWLSRKYGFMDVDNLVSQEVGATLNDMRLNLVTSNTVEWTDHNSLWYSELRKTITMMTFDRPVVVLVHSEECAWEMGAKVIGVFSLADTCFEQNISRRNSVGKLFSRISREFVLRRSYNEPQVVGSNAELHARVVDTCNVYGIPIAAPLQYGSKNWNENYSRDTPGWLLRGEVDDKKYETDHVLRMHDEGMIPKECVDHYIITHCPSERAYGFGVTLNDWGSALAKVAGGIKEAQDFNTSEDMFEVFPPGSQAEKHRVNITLKRMQEELGIWDDPMCYEIAVRHVGEKHVFVTGLLSHWMGVGRHLEIADSIFPLYLHQQSSWNKVMAEVHNLARISNWYCTTRIDEPTKQSLMYMNMLTGREMYQADWKKVLGERESPEGTDYVSFDPIRRVWSRAQYLADFTVALTEAYDAMFSSSVPVDVDSFVQFWKKRRNWVAKGSTVLNKLPKEMLKYNIDFISKVGGKLQSMEMRHNKKSLFESNIILDLLDETVETWNATKVVPKLNETGKKRELLPGTLMHYLVFSYVLYIAERQKQVGTTRLNLNADDDIKHFDRKMMGRQHHMLYDWANFNAQHSKDDMAKVISWLKYIPTAPSDYAFYCDAIAESFHHMYLYDEDGGKHKLEKGLFSGWRGTTWINTVLNYVYVSIGAKCCQRIYGTFEINYVDHGGDDLDISFKKPEDCYHLLEVMDSIGYEATAIKQMIDLKAEFYRNTITTKGVFASPTRGLANFVSGNWETGGAKTLSEKTTSILDQVWKLRRRGVDEDFCYKLAKMALRHWLKIKCDDDWVEIQPGIMHARLEDGGLGIPDENGEVWVLREPIRLKSGVDLAFQLPGVYCSQDYVEVVEDELRHMNMQLVGKRGLINKLAEQSYDLAQFEERAILTELNGMSIDKIWSEAVIKPLYDDRIMERFWKWANSGGDRVRTVRVDALSEFIGHISVNNYVLTKKDLISLYIGKLVTEEAVEFKGNVYYRRLVPEFLANMADGYARWQGNEWGVDRQHMQKLFCTICYMCSEIYEHMA